MARKKAFFQEKSIGDIKKGRKVKVDNFLEILRLQDEDFLILIPFVPRGYESARKFMKHGPEVKPKRFYSLEQALKDGRTPVQLREEAFNNIQGYNFCGYTFMPLGRDRRKRKVSLIECLEGVRLFAYSNQTHGAEILIKPYADSKRVRVDGAEIVAKVPSRTEKEPKIQLKFISVPVVDSSEKYAISLNLGSDHSCSAKRFNIRYRYTDDKEGSGIVNMCAHEIAAYLKIIEYFWNEKKNLIPLQMCQFAIPTQETVDYYLKLGNNVLIRDPELKSKSQLRKLNRAEKEIALWDLVGALGHDRTFYSKKSKDGDVSDYGWNIE